MGAKHRYIDYHAADQLETPWRRCLGQTDETVESDESDESDGRYYLMI